MARRRSYGSDESWHLDKRVPIALILTILIQAGTIVAWASGVTNDITTLTRDVATLTAESKERGVKFEEVISLKVEVRHINDSIARIEAALEKALTFGRSADAGQAPGPRPRYEAR